MTGDESYHASCFACRACRRHITELVFAKTSHGIYCMACHNERVARSKRLRKQGTAKPREAPAKEKEKTQSSIPLPKGNDVRVYLIWFISCSQFPEFCTRDTA